MSSRPTLVKVAYASRVHRVYLDCTVYIWLQADSTRSWHLNVDVRYWIIWRIVEGFSNIPPFIKQVSLGCFRSERCRQQSILTVPHSERIHGTARVGWETELLSFVRYRSALLLPTEADVFSEVFNQSVVIQLLASLHADHVILEDVYFLLIQAVVHFSFRFSIAITYSVTSIWERAVIPCS